MAIQRQKRRDSTAQLALVTPAQGVHGFDTTRLGGVWGDGATVGGVPYPNFAELINNAFNGVTARSDESPDDPNSLIVTVDSRYNNAQFLNGSTFKTFAELVVKFPLGNTGAVDLTVEYGLGGSSLTKNLNKIDADDTPAELSSGDIVAGGIYRLVFDGTQWLLIGGVGAGAGTFDEVAQSTFSTASEVEFLNLSSGYHYRLFIDDIIASAGDFTYLYGRVSDDNGSTYKTTGYDGAYSYWDSSAATTNYGNETTLFNMMYSSLGGTYKSSIQVDMWGCDDGGAGDNDFNIWVRGAVPRATGAGYLINSHGKMSTRTNDIDAFKFYPSSGTITGKYRLQRREI